MWRHYVGEALQNQHREASARRKLGIQLLKSELCTAEAVVDSGKNGVCTLPAAQPSGRPIRFGVFELDADSGELRKQGVKIKLQDQPFQILQVLLERAGGVVTREELQKRIWASDTFVDFDKGLYNAVKKLREALGDDPATPRYIETIPKRGYRFIAPLRDDNHGGPTLLMPTEPDQAAPAPERQFFRKRVASAFFLMCLAAAGAWLWRWRPAEGLTEKDTVVLADFANATGDAVFDDTLKTALNLSLRQSPFLNVLPESEVAKTLQLMTRPEGARVTSEVAREICQRMGSKAYIAGSIASLGSQYVVGLRAVNCQSGDTLAEEQVTAASKEKVLDALGTAASKLRPALGESLATVRRFDVPLEQATTSSLYALKAYSLGIRTFNERGPAAALPYHQRAVELDPNFALGQWAVGDDYGSLGQVGRASEYFSKAYQLRERASERERLTITGVYHAFVTGQLDKAAQTYQEELESYARDPIAHGHLGVVLSNQGRYEEAAEITRQALRLAPDQTYWYDNLSAYAIASQRFEEARLIIREAQAKNVNDFQTHGNLYALAFLAMDSAAMAEQQGWFAGKPEENMGLALASDTEAYGGRLDKARELSKRAVDSAIRTDSKENGAIWQENAAIEQAAYGNPAEARQAAEEALKLAPTSPGVEVEAALAFAMAGDMARAESLAQNVGKRYPVDTQMQSLWLPAIEAQLALDEKNPVSALSVLQAASVIELGSISFLNNASCLYHAYIRGEAYLAAGQGKEAAAEFQKIVDHSGIVWNCWTGAFAHLGVARGNALQARSSSGADADAARSRAVAAYKEFFALWKDADPDIPVLRQARAEYARLR
jgi:DNA-binding winged helix-turn-helix (wHTH) protein/tetratricopeptide (TPR) repeat protein